MAETILKKAADLLWGDWLLVALMGLGIFYTVMTGGIQFRCVSLIQKGFFRNFQRRKNSSEKTGRCTSYQALCAAIASCVGSGNIVGVSTAILSGGPGALFWMWIAAFFGMATKYGEIILGICYHGYDEKGNITGGPMYYISVGMNWKWGGELVAVLLFVQNAGATLIQSNTISQVTWEAFHIPHLITGMVVAAIMSLIVKGGFERLVQVAQRIVPFMAVLYLAGGMIVLCMNLVQLPSMLSSIIRGAFSIQAGAGALAGITMKEAMRYGVTRGLYSNEAGEGSAAVLHASAEVDHPVRQGFYGIFEVFIDTILICSTTGFAILITGANQFDTNAATLAATAYRMVFPGMQYVVYTGLLLFAGTSIMSQWYFGHVSLTYLKKVKWSRIYKYVFPVLILLGSMGTIKMVWSIQDCALGLLIIPNIVALVFLAPEVRRLTEEFFDHNNGCINRKETGK